MWRLQQAHIALGSRLEEEKGVTAQLNSQILDGQAAAAKLQRSIADLEQQVSKHDTFELFLSAIG